MSMDEFPLVEMSGAPRVRGRMHGAAVPDHIARSIALYRAQLNRRGVADDEIDLLARAMLPKIEAFDRDYLDEMIGIAEGARCSLEEIVLINCRTEMMFGNRRLNPVHDNLEQGCTGFIVMPEAAETGRLMHCHNWDWRAECVDTGVVLRIAREDGPDVLTFAEAGGLMRHGFNAAGVSLTGNFLLSDRDFQSPADVPLVLVRRKMLEAASLSDAMRVVWNTRRFCSNNLMLSQSTSDGDAEAVDLECAPDEIFWEQPRDDILVHANHWMAASARAKIIDQTLITEPDSIYRWRRVTLALRGLLASGRTVGWDAAREILSDEFGFPDGVLCHPKPASYDSVCTTVATTLMDPAGGVMWVARKPYAGRRFVEYRL